MKKRNSGIELLKIFAIIIIIISHSVPTTTNNGFIQLGIATKEIQNLFITLMKYLGSIGNSIFIICSSYFLLDNDKVDPKKILHMMIDVFIISVIFMVSLSLFNYDLAAKEIIKGLVPNILGLNWFVQCYIIFYTIHPILNRIVDILNHEKHLLVLIVMFFMYSFIGMIKYGKFYYNDLVGFIVIYFICSYMKKYLINFSNNQKKNYIVAAIGLLGIIFSIIIYNSLGFIIPILSDKTTLFAILLNPFLLFLSFGLFNIFKNNVFYNNIINYISSLSLLIYIIHENYFVYGHIRVIIFNYMKELSYNNYVVMSLILAFFTMIIALLLSIIYKLIFEKIITKMSETIYKFISKLYKTITKPLLKIN